MPEGGIFRQVLRMVYLEIIMQTWNILIIFFGFDWWHMMASNVAENKDSRDWVAAQWWKSGDNTPDNLSGLHFMLCLHWDRQQGLVKPILPKFNSTELEGTVLILGRYLVKGNSDASIFGWRQ